MAHTFTRVCPVCGVKFTTDNARTIYCSLEHKKQASNQRYYDAHPEIKDKNNERQKRQRARLQELDK